MKRLLIAGAAIAVALALALAYGAIQAHQYLNTPVNAGTDGVEYTIQPGSSLHAVSEELTAIGVTKRPLILRAYGRWLGVAGSIQAGDYLIRPGTTPAQLLEQFASGDVQLYSFTIVEGWNHWELLQALHDNEYIDATLTDEDWAALLEELGAEGGHPEGLFLPETYRFPRNSSDRDILQQAYSLMQEVLAEEWSGRAEDLPITTPYEALVLASIIEKETARVDERHRISGVFTRRLQKRMRLQTDPTVIYGIGPSFNGNLTRRDLRTDTPYNTYTRGGLPPTPIAMPGRAAINAALHPEDGEELFFVATGLGDGSHAFSTTKEEHDAAVAEYLRRLRQQRN
ncbi:MAG: endolytic transglycosylase MltG [Woeseiaceae bacterium]|nr:endolytic transglycosylase MltG [Woeseiaceae bacterium]